MIDKTLSVGEAAHEIGTAPRHLTRRFYDRTFPDTVIAGCPIINGRRRIPASLIPHIRRHLKAQGILPTKASGAELIY